MFKYVKENRRIKIRIVFSNDLKFRLKHFKLKISIQM